MAPLGELWGQRDDSIRTRKFWNDERSQSVVIGTVLVFGIGILLLAVLQTTLIPAANEDVEAEHSQQVRGQMQDLRNDIVRSAGSGADLSQDVKLGVDYPPRAFFLNPGPAAGSINTAGTTDDDVALNITNAEALDEETDDYWNGTSKLYGTGAVIYRPGYNIYSNAPNAIVVENSYSYNEFDSSTLLTTDQRVIDGRKISLVALSGNLSQSEAGQISVDTTAVSASTQTIAIENTSRSSPIKVSISTRLSEKILIQDVFADEIDDDGGAPGGSTSCSAISPDNSSSNDRFINNCEFDSTAPGEFNNFTLIMEANTTYNLKLSKIRVGTGDSTTSAAYINDVEGDNASIAQGGRQEITIQVRDKYNNPVSGETVNISIGPNPGTLYAEGQAGSDLTNLKTDEEGKITVLYEAPFSAGSGQITVKVKSSYRTDPSNNYGSFNQEAPENVSTTVRVYNGSQVNRAVPLLNPPSGIIITGANYTDESGPPPSSCTDCVLNITFKNNASVTRNISALRYAFYSADSQGAAGSGSSAKLVLQDTTPPTDLVIKGPFSGVDFDLNPGEEIALKFKAYCDESETDTLNIDQSEFFVIEGLENNTKGKTWLVSPAPGPGAGDNSGGGCS